MSAATIKLGRDEAERMLATLPGSAELWDELADVFLDAQPAAPGEAPSEGTKQ